MTEQAGLDLALAAYWDAAYAEGRDNRQHDTVDGAAQRALMAVRAALDAAVAAERERYADLMQAVEWLLDDGHMDQEHLARIRGAWERACDALPAE